MRRRDPKPDDAWWDDKDKEWVHGAKDDQGRLVGEVRYWNEQGSLISTADHVAGKPHGTARRFIDGEMSQECTYVDGVIDGVRKFVRPAVELQRCSESVVAYECIYDKGDLIGTTYRRADGREVDQHGRPLRKRPPNIPPTASPFPSDGWLWMRRRGEAGEVTLESWEYYEDGTPKLSQIGGEERAYYKNGQLSVCGRREKHKKVGAWKIYDATGTLRRIEHYEAGEEVRRVWHRTASEARGHATVREGAVERRQEVGRWTMCTPVEGEASATTRVPVDGDLGGAREMSRAHVDGDPGGAREMSRPHVDGDLGGARETTRAPIEGGDSDARELGSRTTDSDLLAHAVTGDHLDDDIATIDCSIVSMLARARRAGIAKDVSLLGLSSEPAWLAVSDKGELIPLRAAGASYDSPITRCLAAMRWGPPDAQLLAQLAQALFRADRAQAALDVIDAALLLGNEPRWTTARTAYLRATGDAPVTESALDDRARALLEEIRRNPDDDAPRLVFADHIASEHPEHTAVIVAQCAGRNGDGGDKRVVAAFTDTLPEWLRSTPVRGFIEDFRYAEAEQFVNADPDQLYRVAPSCRAIDLQYATNHVAQLVTLPWIRRFVELSFHDTYLTQVQAQQLARCPHLDDLEHLGLWDTGLDDEELIALCAGPAYPRLQSIDIGHHRDSMSYGLKGMHALGDAAFAKTLRVLLMTNRWLGDGLVDVLAKLPALEYLDVTNGNLTDNGARRLLDLPNQWTDLVLAGSDIGASMREALTARFGDRVRFTRS